MRPGVYVGDDFFYEKSSSRYEQDASNYIEQTSDHEFTVVSHDKKQEISYEIEKEQITFYFPDQTVSGSWDTDQKELYDLSGNLLYTVEDGKKGELVSDGILQVTYSEEEKETVDGESEYVEVDKTDYYDLKGKKLFSEMDTADSKMVLEPSEEV